MGLALVLLIMAQLGLVGAPVKWRMALTEQVAGCSIQEMSRLGALAIVVVWGTGCVLVPSANYGSGYYGPPQVGINVQAEQERLARENAAPRYQQTWVTPTPSRWAFQATTQATSSTASTTTPTPSPVSAAVPVQPATIVSAPQTVAPSVSSRVASDDTFDDISDDVQIETLRATIFDQQLEIDRLLRENAALRSEHQLLCQQIRTLRHRAAHEHQRAEEVIAALNQRLMAATAEQQRSIPPAVVQVIHPAPTTASVSPPGHEHSAFHDVQVWAGRQVEVWVASLLQQFHLDPNRAMAYCQSGGNVAIDVAAAAAGIYLLPEMTVAQELGFTAISSAIGQRFSETRDNLVRQACSSMIADQNRHAK